MFPILENFSWKAQRWQVRSYFSGGHILARNSELRTVRARRTTVHSTGVRCDRTRSEEDRLRCFNFSITTNDISKVMALNLVISTPQ